MHLDNWKSPLHLQAGEHLCQRQQEDEGLAQGAPFGGEVCPPSSLDCNSFDYFVRGVFELLVISKFRNKSNDLIQKMKEVMGSLGRDTLAKACTSFRSKIEAVFKAAGSFIEYVDCQYVSLLIFFYFNQIG
jgi:hypothetical protein